VRAATLLVASVLIAGCGDRTTSPAAGTFTPRTAGVLTVVTSEIPSPGFWEGSQGHPAGGFEYELARLLAERFGLHRVRVEIESFRRIVKGHLAGADLSLDLITPTSERERRLSFSSAYLDADPTVLTRRGTSVPDLETARGLRWGAVRGTTFVGIIDSLIAPEAPVKLFEDNAAVVSALDHRHIDAALQDLPLAVVTARRSAGRLQAAAQLPHPEAIAAALPKDSSNAEAVDSALRAFQADGTIDRLLRRWVGSDAANAETSIPLLQTGR